MAPIRVLRTRLLKPRLPPACLPRPRLVRSVAHALGGPLVAVTAGAGYGKTTLLVQAIDAAGLPTVWCSCDRDLPHAGAVLAHLTVGIAERFPGFGVGLSSVGHPNDLVRDLWDEVAVTVSDDLVIALDDVHLLPRGAAAVLAELVESAPPQVHFVLASREELPFSLARLRAAGAREVTERELALTADETAALLAAWGHRDGPPIAALMDRTEGWAAGLVLASQAVARADRIVPAEFEYLAEEILGALAADERQFLLDTAVLGRFTPALAAAVSGRADAEDRLNDLVARHLFTVRLGDAGDWYRYHHLLQEALRHQLGAAPERARACHRRAAEWWSGQGEVLEAARHLLEAGDPQAAADALEPAAEQLARSEHAGALAELLERIPSRLRADRPALVLAGAMALIVRARFEEDFAHFAEAVSSLVELGDHERAAIGLVQLQHAMLLAGASPSQRIALAAPLAEQISPRAPLLPAGRLLLAAGYAYGGRFEDAEEELGRAGLAAAAVRAPLLGVLARVVRAFYVELWRGVPERAIAALRQACLALEREAASDRLNSAVFARILLAYAQMAIGHEEVVEEASERREEQRQRGIGQSGARRSMPWGETYARIVLGRWEEAAATAPPPEASLAAGVRTSYGYRNRVVAARLAGHRGDRATAETQIALARAEMANFGRAFDDAMFLADLALAAHDVGLPELAAELSDQARASAAEMGLPWWTARAALVGAHVRGEDPDGDARLAEALALTDRHGYVELWTRRERPIACVLLVRALARGLGPAGAAERALVVGGVAMLAEALGQAGELAEVRARLAALVARVPEAELPLVDRLLRDPDRAVRESARQTWLALRARPRSSLRFVTFGDLRVLRDEHPVPASAYGRAKSRTLLAAVLASGGRAHKEQLCEWLWPELRPERALAALRTTLYELRRAIEPEVDAGHERSCLVADADMVRVVLHEGDSWDAGELREAAGLLGGSAAAHCDALARAASLVGGPFLAEWPYEDWAADTRVELEQLHGELLEGLVRGLGAAGRHTEAVPHARRLVRMAPEREASQRLLMTAYASSGERALALRQFHACRAVLRRTQGIEPGPETRALYRTLLGSVTPA